MPHSNIAPVGELRNILEQNQAVLSSQNIENEINEVNTAMPQPRKKFDLFEYGELFGFKKPPTPDKPVVVAKTPKPFQKIGTDMPIFKANKKRVGSLRSSGFG
jgi:hypothetical protein